jgi:hypothetical protein
VDGHAAARARLANLGLSASCGGDAVDVVRRLGAVQAQDYGPALWSIGARTGQSVQQVERAVLDGDLIRTHVLRPTWHLVPAEDLLWMLDLTAPRVHALTAYYYRVNGLTEGVLDHSRRMIEEALGGGELTRRQLGEGVVARGVDPAGPRFALMLMHAELSGAICSGARLGKQQTYALLDRRVPKSRELSRDDALGELTHRYFSSHGPASVKDFSWWSSLTRADILRGLELTGDRLRCDDLGGVQVWGPQDGRRGVTPDPGTGSAAPQVRLVQAYDEYIVGYTQTKYVLDLSGSTKTRPVDVTVRNHVLLIDGQVAGHWRRTLTRRSVTIEVTLDRSLNPVEHRELEREAAAHGLFLGLEATLEVR